MLNVPFADLLVISLAIGGVCIWWNQGPRKRIVRLVAPSTRGGLRWEPS